CAPAAPSQSTHTPRHCPGPPSLPGHGLLSLRRLHEWYDFFGKTQGALRIREVTETQNEIIDAQCSECTQAVSNLFGSANKQIAAAKRGCGGYAFGLYLGGGNGDPLTGPRLAD